MGSLTVEGLGTHHLQGLTLHVDGGTCLGLTGPSGTGKSLMLRALADLDPHQGRVLLAGEEQQQTPPPLWRTRIGFLPAESGWWAERVEEHFAGGAGAVELIVALGLPEAALQWQVSRLSSGERQRLALGRLLENRPSALLLDEPTANLDPEATQRAERLIRDYQIEHQAPIVWVTHDREQLGRVTDRVVRLEGGRLQEERR